MSKDLRDLLLAHVNAQHLTATPKTHAHRLATRQIDDLVVDRAGLAAADIDDHAGHKLKMLDNAFKIDAPLKAMPRLGAELEFACAPCDRLGPPEGGFHIDVGRVERDRGRCATHDARQAFRRITAANDAHVGVEHDGLVVEQRERFARARPAYVERL